jgi:type I restriction enzyme S subunit
MTAERETQTADIRPPEDWREVALAAVADVRFSSVDKLTFASEEPVRLCNYIDVYKNDYIASDLEFMSGSATQAEIERFGLRVGDVIITKDSETPDDIGVPAVVDYAATDLVCGYHLGLLRVDETQVDPTFVAKQLDHHRLARYFGRQANGLTRYGLGLASVRNTPLWLPKIQEQVTIGRVARLVDVAIARTAAMIVKLKQIRAGLLHDLLTRGLDERNELRPSSTEAPNLYQQSALGQSPKDWRPAVLNDLVRPARPIVYGILMPGRAFPGGVPVIKVKDIKDGHVVASDLLLTDPRIDEAYQRSRLWPDDLLFTIRGTVGRTALVPVNLANANITQDTARISLGWANPAFVALWLEMEAPIRFIAIHTIGVAVRGINLADVRKIPVPIVSRAEQDRIVACVGVIETRTNLELANYEKLRLTKAGLIADLLTGRVRVSQGLDFQGACP